WTRTSRVTRIAAKRRMDFRLMVGRGALGPSCVTDCYASTRPTSAATFTLGRRQHLCRTLLMMRSRSHLRDGLQAFPPNCCGRVGRPWTAEYWARPGRGADLSQPERLTQPYLGNVARAMRCCTVSRGASTASATRGPMQTLHASRS